MRESGSTAQANVLNRKEKFPERKHFRILAPRRSEKVDREDDEISGKNPQGAAGKKSTGLDTLLARERREKLSADEIAAENEEKIYPDPTKTVNPAGKRKSHDAGVVNRDDDDGDGAEEIEPRLAFTIGETRVNGRIGRWLVDGLKLAESGSKKRTRCR